MDDDANRVSAGDLDDPVIDESNEKDVVVTKKLGYNRFMIDNVWRIGKERLAKDNVRSKRLGAVARVSRKLLVKKVVMDAAKETSMTYCQKEEVAVDMPSWTRHIMGLYTNDYTD